VKEEEEEKEEEEKKREKEEEWWWWWCSSSSSSKEVECGGLDWIRVAQDIDTWRALVKAAMNLWVP
jgi:hypothetical protein